MKPTIWIFSLEPLETRYTAQWHTHFPVLLESTLGSEFNIRQVDGIQKHSQPTPGAFLNFSDTNYWKSSQLSNFLELHNSGETSPNDHIIFTDAWNPTVIQLKYMASLLGFNWKLHGLWHAGNYDPADFLGRLTGNTAWVRHAEKSFFESFDYNYFATSFHIELILKNLFGYTNEVPEGVFNRIVRTGWPMEYMSDTLSGYTAKKEDLIIFPHRLAPEKQVDIFKDLATHLPQYKFVICQETTLSKNEYHDLLSRAKVVFSANLQETLGISPFEGALVGAIPMVPNRLSYSEMYFNEFKYPSDWTLNYNNYCSNKELVIKTLVDHIDNYDERKARLAEQVVFLKEQFFSATNLIQTIQQNGKDIDSRQ